MYVKRYVVQRGRRQYVYLRLVEAYRDEQGKVRHRVVASLGREDQLKASGQLDQLAAAFTRLDPPTGGTRREVGPLLLVAHYLDRLGLVDLVDRRLSQRGRAQLSCGEVVAALVANRLAAPAPLYDVAGWASSAAMAEVLEVPGMLLGDDRLGRALEALAPVAEEVRGAVTLAAIDRFGVDAARLHLDLTTLRVAGAYQGSALVRKGWGPDRRIARQVRMLQATNPQGVPLYVRPDPGDTAELACIGAALERLAQLLPPGLLVCADSALGHVKNLCAADRAGLRFVVPLRAASGFAERFLAEVSATRACTGWTTSPTASGTLQRPGGPATGARCAPCRSPTPTPANATRCGSPTSGRRKRPTASPTGANARWSRPSRRSARCSAAWVAATTRPAPRSTPRSPSCSSRPCAACCRSPPAPEQASPPCPSSATRPPSPLPPAPTGSTPWRPTCPGACRPPSCCASTRTSPWSSCATATPSRPCGSARSSFTTTTASPPWSASSGSPWSSSG